MKSTVTVTPELLAQVFCDLSDDDQCKFFVAIGQIVEASEHNWDNQWYYLGGHLRNCDCSTDAARQVITSIYEFMQTSTHK